MWIFILGAIVCILFVYALIRLPLHSRKVERTRVAAEAEALERQARHEVLLEQAKEQVRREQP